LQKQTQTLPPPMLAAVRSRASGHWRLPPPARVLPRLLSSFSTGAAPAPQRAEALLELPEVEKVLRDVRADDVRVFPVGEGGLHGGACADYMVVATGRSDWHVRNIAQALLYKVCDPRIPPFLKVLGCNWDVNPSPAFFMCLEFLDL
jgi:hypothetical protein